MPIVRWPSTSETTLIETPKHEGRGRVPQRPAAWRPTPTSRELGRPWAEALDCTEQLVEVEGLGQARIAADFVTPAPGVPGGGHHHNREPQPPLPNRPGKPPAVERRHAHVEQH